MLQQTTSRVNWSSDKPAQPRVTCACGKMKYCDYSCMSHSAEYVPTATHNAAAVAGGLGSNAAKIPARRAARTMHAVWEHAILFFGKSPAEAAEIREQQAEKAEQREEKSKLRWAEIEAGKAAFLAGIAYDDPVLTKNGRIGWQSAQRSYENGYRLFGKMEPSSTDRAFNAGLEAARVDAALAEMVTL